MKTLFFTISFLLSIFSFGQTESNSIYFESNSYLLSNSQKVKLDSLLLSHPNTDIQLIGYTDSDGDSLYNIKLSKKRAEIIQKQILTKSPSLNVTISYFGENKPLNENKTEAQKAANRRVEFVFTKNVDWLMASSLEELFSMIKPKQQEFCINPEKDTILVGNNGTIILISKGTFNVQKHTECVKIILKERYNKEQIVRENLTTITLSGETMVSQSMFYLDANFNNQSLEFKKPIVIITPVEEYVESSTAFIGEKKDNNYNWKSNNAFVGRLTWMGDGSDYPCTKDTIMYDTTIVKCKNFFCKVKVFLGLLDLKPIIDTIRRTDTIPCLSINLTDNVGINQLGGLNQEDFKKLPITSVKNYVFSVNKGGWHNIDWIMKVPNSKKTKISINTLPNIDIQINLLYTNYRSLVPFESKDNNYILSDAVLGEPATIYAFKVEDGFAFFAMKEIKIDENKEYSLDFKKITLEELYTIIKKFDDKN